jgi:hypothetical protein
MKGSVSSLAINLRYPLTIHSKPWHFLALVLSEDVFSLHRTHCELILAFINFTLNFTPQRSSLSCICCPFTPVWHNCVHTPSPRNISKMERLSAIVYKCYPSRWFALLSVHFHFLLTMAVYWYCLIIGSCSPIIFFGLSLSWFCPLASSYL